MMSLCWLEKDCDVSDYGSIVDSVAAQSNFENQTMEEVCPMNQASNGYPLPAEGHFK